MVQKSLFLAISGMAGNGGGVGLPQEVASKLESVKTDLIAVERNLVSGNKPIESQKISTKRENCKTKYKR